MNLSFAVLHRDTRARILQSKQTHLLHLFVKWLTTIKIKLFYGTEWFNSTARGFWLFITIDFHILDSRKWKIRIGITTL